jgi:hypothetical protein
VTGLELRLSPYWGTRSRPFKLLQATRSLNQPAHNSVLNLSAAGAVAHPGLFPKQLPPVWKLLPAGRNTPRLVYRTAGIDKAQAASAAGPELSLNRCGPRSLLRIMLFGEKASPSVFPVEYRDTHCIPRPVLSTASRGNK